MEVKSYLNNLYILFFWLTLSLFATYAQADNIVKADTISSSSSQNACSPQPIHGIPDESNFTILGFTLLKSSFEDIRAKLGQTEGFQSELKEGVPLDICYRSNQKSDGTIVVFETDDMVITSFRIILGKAPFRWRNKCKKSPFISKNIQTKSGVKLGITQEQLEKILGNKPSMIIGNNLSFTYLGKRKMTNDEIEKLSKTFGAEAVKEDSHFPYWNESCFINAKFLNSKLIDVTIGKIESW